MIYKEEGKHCAFTDVKFHDGFYYVCFRVGDDHMFGKSHIKIMRSNSPSGAWKVYSQTTDYPDIRDPRMMIWDNGNLYLLANIISHSQGRVTGCHIAKGVICEGFTKLSKIPYTNDMFMSSVTFKNRLLCYDAVRGGRLWLIDWEPDSMPVSLPAYEDSTEAASFRKNIFVRRDQGKNYWIILGVMKDEITLFDTQYQIHCPTIFQRMEKHYLLGREMDWADQENWDAIWETQSKCKLWEIKKDLSLAPVKTFDSHADCGYMGYADDLISWYSNYDKAKPHETAIFVEEF